MEKGLGEHQMVYDCFTFFNEYELLELRLETLYNAVDYFVISESNKTHANIPKDYNFEKNAGRYRKYWRKIIYVKEGDVLPYKGKGDWSLEHHQRMVLLKGLAKAKPDDLVFISDLDEIWPPHFLDRLEKNEMRVTWTASLPGAENAVLPVQSLVPAKRLLEYVPLTLQQKMCFYYVNNMDAHKFWSGTVVTRFKNIRNPQWCRDMRFRFAQLEAGGWHFSYQGGIEKIALKMKSIVDGDGRYATKEHIEKILATGGDPYDRTDSQQVHCVPCTLEEVGLPNLHGFVKKYPSCYREPVMKKIETNV